MTIENYYLAELGDIQAVVIQCQVPECGACASFNPAKDIKLISGCPQCGGEWFEPSSFSKQKVVKFLACPNEVRDIKSVRLKFQVQKKESEAKP